MTPLPAHLASGGVQIARSLATAIPDLIGRGASTFGDLLSQQIGESSTAPQVPAGSPTESTSHEPRTRENIEATRALQDRIERVLGQHGIEFGAGMSIQLSSAGRVRVDDHPQAARIESLIRDDPEIKQLVAGLLTGAQLKQAESATNPSGELPSLDELSIRLRPELRQMPESL